MLKNGTKKCQKLPIRMRKVLQMVPKKYQKVPKKYHFFSDFSSHKRNVDPKIRHSISSRLVLTTVLYFSIFCPSCIPKSINLEKSLLLLCLIYKRNMQPKFHDSVFSSLVFTMVPFLSRVVIF